ncbi:MAG: LytTR family DNA-binding domain-containing protein [Gemmatimonadaceae bacterium]
MTTLMRVRALIVDDEPVARRGLRRLLGERGDIDIVGECQNGVEAVEAIAREKPDLVLLDVQMPGLDGFGVVREVGARNMPAVVFVTAFDDFALKAFEIAAVDYVVKPFTKARLSEAVDRAALRIRDRRVSVAHEQLLAALGDRSSPEAIASPATVSQSTAYATRLLVSVGSKSVVVPLTDVTLFQADGYHIRVWSTGSRYTMRGSLQEIETRLDPREFLRVHRSAIVRTSAVRGVERTETDQVFLVLADGTRVPVSRSRREATIATLGPIRG